MKKILVLVVLFAVASFVNVEATECPSGHDVFGGLISTGYNTIQSTGYLLSDNCQFYLCMQGDGNLVVYEGPWPTADGLWNSQTNGVGQGPWELIMQNDGNLVVYDATGRGIWSSNTVGQGQAPWELVMQDDGNLVIYDSTHRGIWSSNTVVV